MSASFEQQRKFFMSMEFTDYRVHCNGTVMNVHKVILATHSEVFRQKMRTHPYRLELPSENDQILTSLFSIMYCGNYSDRLFGNGTHPHALTTLTPASLKSEIDGIGNAGQHLEDEKDQKALNHVFDKIMRHETGVTILLLSSLWHAVSVHVLGHRYQCDLAIAIAFVRIREVAKTLLLDSKELIRSPDIDKFVQVMEKVYTEVPEGAPIRMKLCGLVREFCRRNPSKESYFKGALWKVIPKSPRMKEDLASNHPWA
ncbi:hypothetical protein KJ359_008521 [Pestalotiopsis sp. 9143b]|nr:hypothetical protein KJ359_008521 [Pestalotiopsis sp. 9143b]